MPTIMGTPQSPNKERSEKMNTENRDYTIPIRVSFSEREKIKNRADSVKRNVSTFMRQTALNYEIREKPERNLIIALTKELRDVERAIRNIGRIAYENDFIDEKELERERQNLNKIIAQVKEKLL